MPAVVMQSALREDVTQVFLFLRNSDKPNDQSGSKHTDRWVPRMHQVLN